MPSAPTSSPDPLLETQLFWSRYKGPILIALLVVLLGLAGYGSVRLYQSQQEAAAANMLAQAKAPADYEKVIAEYPKSGAAVSAAILLATAQREKQQFAESSETWQKFLSAHPNSQFASTALMGMAANSQSLGKTDQALTMYRNAATKYPQSYNAPLALLAQAQILKGTGKTAEARRVYETVLTQYRESYASLEATQMLQTLKPEATPAPAPAMSPAAPGIPAAQTPAPPTASP